MFLLAARLGHHHGGGALRAGDHWLRANFSATGVRFFPAPLLTPALQPIRSLESAVKAPPVPLLRAPARSGALPLPAHGSAIDLSAVARAAQQERPPTCVPDALNQTKIVHRLAPPPEIRPPTATCATLDLSNASTAATEGSKVMTSGPYSLVATNRPAPRRAGPTTPLSGALRFPRFSALVHTGIVGLGQRGSAARAIRRPGACHLSRRAKTARARTFRGHSSGTVHA
jgi:hypothetical protein